MLTQFLKAIQTGEMQSLQDIARRLGVSTAMVMQMAQDLTRKGYLQEISSDCDTPQNTCTECPVTAGCHLVARHWFLTEKGLHALAARPE